MQSDQIVESVNGPGTGWGGLGTVEDLELVGTPIPRNRLQLPTFHSNEHPVPFRRHNR